MSIEYCETCDKNIDTDTDINGENIDIEGVYYHYVCSDCMDTRILKWQSKEAAEEDYGRAKARGEI